MVVVLWYGTALCFVVVDERGRADEKSVRQIIFGNSLYPIPNIVIFIMCDPVVTLFTSRQ